MAISYNGIIVPSLHHVNLAAAMGLPAIYEIGYICVLAMDKTIYNHTVIYKCSNAAMNRAP